MSALLDTMCVPSMPSNANDAVAGHQQRVDEEAFPNVCAGFSRRMQQETVEHRATGTQSAHAIVRIGDGAAKGEWAHIERHVPADWWCACRRKGTEKTPPRQDLGAVGPKDVS
jgi:hypothetical protein